MQKLVSSVCRKGLACIATPGLAVAASRVAASRAGAIASRKCVGIGLGSRPCSCEICNSCKVSQTHAGFCFSAQAGFVRDWQ